MQLIKLMGWELIIALSACVVGLEVGTFVSAKAGLMTVGVLEVVAHWLWIATVISLKR